MVMCRHMTPEASTPWLRALMGGGWAGVDLFFVLSGFLVSGLLFREYGKDGSIDYARFFWRRGLKIYPAFLALVLLYGIFEYRIGRSFTLKGLIGELLFVQNYYASLWNHTWSLAVEEHFYLIVGLGITFLSRRRQMDRVPTFAVGVLVVCLLWRCLDVGLFGEINNFATHLRMDSLMFGVLLSYHYHTHPERLAAFFARWRMVLVLAALVSLVSLAIYPFGHPFWETVGYSMLYLAFGILLLWILGMSARMGEHAAFRLLAFIGAHSYSIYLWHMFVKRSFSYLRKAAGIDLPWSVELLSYVAVSVLFGIIMAKLVEVPVLRVRDRYFPSRTGSSPAQPTTVDVRFAPARGSRAEI
jgi:peptidoglycan/LPS O-acetylase OafA/YrhL